MDGELPAVPLVAVRDREAHHPGARFEMRHASAQPMVDRAGKDVEAPVKGSVKGSVLDIGNSPPTFLR